MKRLFRDRAEAGRVLADRLKAYTGRTDVVVLALPRGGVPVGFEVARALQVPLDVLIVRKLGAPDDPELAMGAIASGGVQVLNEELLRYYPVSADAIAEVVAREQRELERRERVYRGQYPPAVVEGRIVILVDDGIATGTTMRSALEALEIRGAARIVIAVPVAPPTAREEMTDAERQVSFVCLATPDPFVAVGVWYENFTQTTDDEVREKLEESARQQANVA